MVIQLLTDGNLINKVICTLSMFLVDTENCLLQGCDITSCFLLKVCRVSAGHLTLSLDKDSFEILGFEGKPSRFKHRTATRFGLSTSHL